LSNHSPTSRSGLIGSDENGSHILLAAVRQLQADLNGKISALEKHAAHQQIDTVSSGTP